MQFLFSRLIALLLCASTILAAPQKDSKITYVKRQAEPATQSPLKNTGRESRIENLPLTVPGGTADEADTKNTETNQPTNDPPIYNYSDRIYSVKTKAKNTRNATKTTVAPVETANNTDNGNTDIVQPSESVQTDTLAKAENTTLKYETDFTEAEIVTEKYEEDLTIATDVDEETTKAPSARFLSKLSHFGKSSSGSFSQNLISSPGKRRFRSRCRCERIWNCAKLQISVPRCPEEYFLCCS